jgi:hypothetical protein
MKKKNKEELERIKAEAKLVFISIVMFFLFVLFLYIIIK